MLPPGAPHTLTDLLWRRPAHSAWPFAQGNGWLRVLLRCKSDKSILQSQLGVWYQHFQLVWIGNVPMFHPDQEPMFSFQYHSCAGVQSTNRLLLLRPYSKKIWLSAPSVVAGSVSRASVGCHDLVVLGKRASWRLHSQQGPGRSLGLLCSIWLPGFEVGVTAANCYPGCSLLFSVTNSSATVAIASFECVYSVIKSATTMPYSAWLSRLMASIVPLLGYLNSSARPFLDSAPQPTFASSVHEASVVAQGEEAPPSDSLGFAAQFVAAAIISVPGIGIVDSLLVG